MKTIFTTISPLSARKPSVGSKVSMMFMRPSM